jgi:uncharacterized delta-60 repeat protein
VISAASRNAIEALEGRLLLTAVVSGQTIAGNIATGGQQDTYTFSATAGQTFEMSLGAASASSTFRPELTILNPSSTQVFFNFDGNLNSSVSGVYHVPSTAAGTYTAIVQGDGASNTGAYALELASAPATQAVDADGDGGTISSGQTKTGTINRAGDLDIFTFDATAGQTFEMSLGAASAASTYRPELYIYDSSGTQVFFNFNGNANSSVTGVYHVPSTGAGTYTAVVQADGASNTGAYALELASGPASQAADADGDGGTIASGQTRTGTINRSGDLDVFTFNASAGQTFEMSLGAGSSASTFLPELYIYDSSGTQVFFDFNGNLNSSVRGIYHVPSTDGGTYTAVVQGDGASNIGAYALELASAPATQAADAEGDGGTISSGQTKTGTVNRAGDLDVFTFDAAAGQTFQMSLGAASSASTFLPELYIYDSSGTQVFFDFNGNINSSVTGTYHVPSTASGTYTAVVQADGAGNTGAYALELASAPAIQTADADGDGGTIGSGQTKTGTINRSGDLDLFTFGATVGDHITVTLDSTSSVEPFQTVYGPNGTQVGSAFSGQANSSVQVNYTVPSGATGQYTAVLEDNAGRMTGGYSVTLNGAVAPPTAAPAVTIQPQDQLVQAGGTTTFTAAASGIPVASVQWEFSTDRGATFAPIVGATSNTLQISPVSVGQNGNEYRAIFHNGAGTDAITSAAKLTVTAAPPTPVKAIGVLDPTFGTNGLASNNLGFASTAGVAVQNDGKSLIIGAAGASSSQQFGLCRCNPDGSLDKSFGNNSIVTSSFGGSDQSSAVAYLPGTGDILVAGTDTTASGSRFVLAEYTSAGVLDTTFNGIGYVFTSFSITPGTLSHDTAKAITVSADGSTIYVAGSSDAGGKGLDFAVASYNADGSVNTRFNTTGTALLDFAGGDDAINAIALQTNSDLVAAGTSTNPTSGVTSVALTRFLPPGTIDPHFGSKGKILTNVRGVADVASSVGLDHTGKIIIGGLSATGSASDSSLSSDFLVARYTATGIIDRTFNGGTVITSFGQPSAVSQVLIQSNGKVVASGKTVASLNGLDPSQLPVALARYTTAGKLDTTFNATGTAIISLSGASASPQAAQTARPSVTMQTASISSFELTSFALPLALSPQDATSSLQQAFAQFQQSSQGVVALTPGGQLLDVGNSGTNTVEAELVTAGVDLAAALIAKLPPAALEGAKGLMSVKITESGSDLAGGMVTIQLYASLDGQINGLTPFQSFPERISLRQNQSRTFPLRYSLPSGAGTYFLVVNVDTGSLPELDTNNNSVFSSSAVTVAAPFVDLAGTGLTSTGTPAVGKFTTVTFTVVNNGNILARSIPVQVLASTDGNVANGTQISEPTLSLNLPAGITRKYRLTFKVPATLAANTYVLVAVLDPNGNRSTILGLSTQFVVA